MVILVPITPEGDAEVGMVKQIMNTISTVLVAELWRRGSVVGRLLDLFLTCSNSHDLSKFDEV